MKIRRRFSDGGLPTQKWITEITGTKGTDGDGIATPQASVQLSVGPSLSKSSPLNPTNMLSPSSETRSSAYLALS